MFSSILEYCLISTAIPFTARQVDTVVQVVTQATPIIRNDHHFLSIISFTRTKIVQAGLKNFFFYLHIISAIGLWLILLNLKLWFHRHDRRRRSRRRRLIVIIQNASIFRQRQIRHV